MIESIGNLSGRRKAAVGALCGAVILGVGAASQEAGASTKYVDTTKSCINDASKNVHTQFDKTSPNTNYCLKEAFPMGRTNILNNGNYGELGLVAIKMTFEGKLYACVVPVTGHDSVTTLTPEAFSLNEDCLPDPGNK